MSLKVSIDPALPSEENSDDGDQNQVKAVFSFIKRFYEECGIFFMRIDQTKIGCLKILSRRCKTQEVMKILLLPSYVKIKYNKRRASRKCLTSRNSL